MYMTMVILIYRLHHAKMLLWTFEIFTNFSNRIERNVHSYIHPFADDYQYTYE